MTSPQPQPLFEPIYNRGILRVEDPSDGATKFLQPMHITSFEVVDNAICVQLSVGHDQPYFIAARLASHASAGAALIKMLNTLFGDKKDDA